MPRVSSPSTRVAAASPSRAAARPIVDSAAAAPPWSQHGLSPSLPLRRRLSSTPAVASTSPSTLSVRVSQTRSEQAVRPLRAAPAHPLFWAASACCIDTLSPVCTAFVIEFFANKHRRRAPLAPLSRLPMRRGSHRRDSRNLDVLPRLPLRFVQHNLVAGVVVSSSTTSSTPL
ncbi:hypothetical protein U9M48_036236 [Paspalum notatum var. saurae]|uniref:Uncharacterized protein n=1 Tax=Paspalum notatum var. saurae TaxID=547442 RepID=A0AAQ3UGT5_PASNO